MGKWVMAAIAAVVICASALFRVGACGYDSGRQGFDGLGVRLGPIKLSEFTIDLPRDWDVASREDAHAGGELVLSTGDAGGFSLIWHRDDSSASAREAFNALLDHVGFEALWHDEKSDRGCLHLEALGAVEVDVENAWKYHAVIHCTQSSRLVMLQLVGVGRDDVSSLGQRIRESFDPLSTPSR